MSNKRQNKGRKAREPTELVNHPPQKQNKSRKPKRIRSGKNVSKTIRNGTVIYTRDEYFEDNNGYRKPEYLNTNKLYRWAVVVDSNQDDDMSVIKLENNGINSVINKSNKVQRYNPYIKTKDNDGKPIRLGQKFKRGDTKFDVSEKDANKMKMEALGYDKKSKRIQNKNHMSPTQRKVISEKLKQREELKRMKGRIKKEEP